MIAPHLKINSRIFVALYNKILIELIFVSGLP